MVLDGTDPNGSIGDGSEKQPWTVAAGWMSAIELAEPRAHPGIGSGGPVIQAREAGENSTESRPTTEMSEFVVRRMTSQGRLLAGVRRR